MSSGLRRGFSLMESLVSMTIVSMVAISTLEAVSAGFETAFRARRAIEMTALVNQRLDYLDLLQAADLQSLPDSLSTGVFDPPNNQYRWQMSAAPYATQPGVFDVTIQIINVLGIPQIYTTHTYVYRRAAMNAVGSTPGGF